MNEPKVAVIMLVDGRHDMAHRAIRSFMEQTYRPVKMIAYETVRGSHTPLLKTAHYGPFVGHAMLCEPPASIKIGELRNRANDIAKDADILIHWDSDDVSHPLRIEEQVALLRSSGADVVGYSDMLFWRGNDAPHHIAEEPDTWDGEQAWLYQNNDRGRYCLGTSLCYWRKVWEAKPFNPKLPERRGGTGEDTEWLRGLKCVAVSSLGPSYESDRLTPDTMSPRMVASIHGSNTQDYKGIEKSGNSWTRVPEWDSYCRKVMEL